MKQGEPVPSWREYEAYVRGVYLMDPNPDREFDLEDLRAHYFYMITDPVAWKWLTEGSNEWASALEDIWCDYGAYKRGEGIYRDGAPWKK